MMSTPQEHCDEPTLVRLLTVHDPQLEQDGDTVDALEHVEHCERCQQKLAELAAGDVDWQEAQSALREVAEEPLPARLLDSIARGEFSHTDSSAAKWTAEMAKSLLGPPSHPELLGRLGRYDIERLLGVGGMAIVFKAFDTELNRPVAIKVLAPFLSSSGTARQRFAREAQAAAAIVHEHVVPIHDVETEGELPYMVMQYICGESLQERLDRQGPLPLAEVLRIGQQIAAGLSAAHAQGLVHRDVKPSNVLLEEHVSRALLADFGLARAADDAQMTRTGFHVGTPLYMSPEQAQGERIDARSDLFSLGSLLYVMSTGRAPFRADTPLGVVHRITQATPQPLSDVDPRLPGWFSNLVARLMAKAPADRFASAEQVAQLLTQCLAHLEAPQSHQLPAGQFRLPLFHRMQRMVSDSRILSWVALGLFLVGVLLPWPVMAIGRDEAGLAMGATALIMSLILALLSARERLSRMVFGLLASGLVLLGIAVLIFVFPARFYQAQLRAELAMAEAMQAHDRELMAELQARQDRQVTDLQRQWTSRIEQDLKPGMQQAAVIDWLAEHTAERPGIRLLNAAQLEFFPADALEAARQLESAATFVTARIPANSVTTPSDVRINAGQGLAVWVFFDSQGKSLTHLVAAPLPGPVSAEATSAATSETTSGTTSQPESETEAEITQDPRGPASDEGVQLNGTQ